MPLSKEKILAMRQVIAESLSFMQARCEDIEAKIAVLNESPTEEHHDFNIAWLACNLQGIPPDIFVAVLFQLELIDFFKNILAENLPKHIQIYNKLIKTLRDLDKTLKSLLKTTTTPERFNSKQIWCIESYDVIYQDILVISDNNFKLHLALLPGIGEFILTSSILNPNNNKTLDADQKGKAREFIEQESISERNEFAYLKDLLKPHISPAETALETVYGETQLAQKAQINAILAQAKIIISSTVQNNPKVKQHIQEITLLFNRANELLAKRSSTKVTPFGNYFAREFFYRAMELKIAIDTFKQWRETQPVVTTSTVSAPTTIDVAKQKATKKDSAPQALIYSPIMTTVAPMQYAPPAMTIESAELDARRKLEQEEALKQAALREEAILATIAKANAEAASLREQEHAQRALLFQHAATSETQVSAESGNEDDESVDLGEEVLAQKISGLTSSNRKVLRAIMNANSAEIHMAFTYEQLAAIVENLHGGATPPGSGGSHRSLKFKEFQISLDESISAATGTKRAHGGQHNDGTLPGFYIKRFRRFLSERLHITVALVNRVLDERERRVSLSA